MKDPPDIDPGENVLLRSPPFDKAVEEHCVQLLASQPSESAVLEVTFLHSPAERIAAWGQYCGFVPYDWTIIIIDGEDTEEDVPVELKELSASPTTVSVPASNNLTTLGTRITDRLEQLADRKEEVMFCFYSLTSLFQYPDRGHSLKFIDSLTEKTSAVGARAHYHVDPSAHSTETLEAIKERFDTIHTVE